MEMTTLLFLGFILVQRMSELVIAKRNTANLLAKGAHEVGAAHYPVMVAMHSVDRRPAHFWIQ
jgi:methyltransferase